MTRAFDKIKKGLDEALVFAKDETEYLVYINKTPTGIYMVSTNKEPEFLVEDGDLTKALKKACDAFNAYNKLLNKDTKIVMPEHLTRVYNSGKIGE